MEKLQNIISYLETIAPQSLQESYDNAGLITGSAEMKITGAIICLDSTEAVIDEAIANGFNLVIAHHPIVFSGIKKLNGKNYVERIIIKAIKNDIAIYAIHTNLDNVFDGVNNKICKMLGLNNLQILAPKSKILKKLGVFVPVTHSEIVRNALFEAGAGKIGNYDECSFSQNGIGTFRGNDQSNPVLGEKGLRSSVNEDKIDVVYEGFMERKILTALQIAHPYEEIAYEILSIDNQYNRVGSGMIGDFEIPLETVDFLEYLKKKMKTSCIRYSRAVSTSIKRVAVCGGAGSFLVNDAINAGADVFITSDMKYHQFFDAGESLMIADIGHYESEQFTKELIYDILKDKFHKFALRLTEINTNPINYF